MSPAAKPVLRPTSRADAVARAISLLGQGRYKLGGGADVTAPSPFDTEGNRFPGYCDCSGFTSHVTGHARDQGKREYNTDAIVRDAKTTRALYRVVARAEVVLPGDLLVYPGIFDLDDDPDRDVPGHIGIIVEVRPEFVRLGEEWWEDVEVIHCSPRKQRALGAIRQTDATLWASRGYFVRPLHYT